MAKKSSVARTAMPEVDNVIDLSEATFGRAVETYVEARTEKDEAEARPKVALEIGENGKPTGRYPGRVVRRKA